MTAYAVEPAGCIPCFFPDAASACEEARSLFDEHEGEITIRPVKMTEEKFESLEEHGGY